MHSQSSITWQSPPPSARRVLQLTIYCFTHSSQHSHHRPKQKTCWKLSGEALVALSRNKASPDCKGHDNHHVEYLLGHGATARRTGIKDVRSRRGLKVSSPGRLPADYWCHEAQLQRIPLRHRSGITFAATPLGFTNIFPNHCQDQTHVMKAPPMQSGRCSGPAAFVWFAVSKRKLKLCGHSRTCHQPFRY
jgi:hypothetical protein